ncbi:MAG: hypothetical protein LC623_04525, partial [Halobacteriales archaeon]|nr:hypothetical protein [Halobacteriales archaeon]
NLTDEQARHLPGDVPQVLMKAKQMGTAYLHLDSSDDVSRLSQGVNHSRYIRYQGTIFLIESVHD